MLYAGLYHGRHQGREQADGDHQQEVKNDYQQVERMHEACKCAVVLALVERNPNVAIRNPKQARSPNGENGRRRTNKSRACIGEVG